MSEQERKTAMNSLLQNASSEQKQLAQQQMEQRVQQMQQRLQQLQQNQPVQSSNPGKEEEDDEPPELISNSEAKNK
jgi:hypothetical protein